jgi:hypothetical protein
MINDNVDLYLSSLIGQVLEMISFTQNTVVLHFNKNSMVTIYANTCLQAGSIELKMDLVNILNMVGSKVIKVDTKVNKDLLDITLDSGINIKIPESGVFYESYSLLVGDFEYIV